jgi:TonB family protein
VRDLLGNLDARDDRPAGVPARLVSAWHVAAGVSIALHIAIAAIGVATRTPSPAVMPQGRVYPLPDSDEPIIVELPQMSAEKTADKSDVVAVPLPEPVQAGGAKVAHVDSEHAGKGGDITTTMKARNLAAHAEDETTTTTYRDAIDAEQENRLKTAKLRQSKIDVRYALEPMELTFVASGKGFRYERHPIGKDGSIGVPGGKGVPSGVASIGQGQALPGEGAPKSNGGDALGGASSPKGGAAYGKAVVGLPSEVGANVAKGRPHVFKGKPNVTSNTVGSASDTIDSDQAVAAALKSAATNSTYGGVALAEGKGGSGGGDAPGAGGNSGAGSKTAALGNGSGPADAPFAIERTSWFLGLQKRLGPLVSDAFPRERELELRNGTVIVDLVIAKGGGVVDVIVVRPSGFDDFDQNVVTRIRGAGKLEPVPDLLSKGSITVRVPVQGGWRLQ